MSKSDTITTPAQSLSAEESERISAGNPSTRSNSKVLAGILVLVLIVVGLGVRYWLFSGSQVSTNDAYLSSSLTQIAPQVSATVKEVLVSENQRVKKGDLLVVLDDAGYQASADQAKANLDMAIAQAHGAGVTVSVTAQSGDAQIVQAQGAAEQASSGIAGSQADLARSDAVISTAVASEKSAQANVAAARAALEASIANKERFQDAIKSAQAAVDATQAVYDKAVRDVQRAASLYSNGAISEQAADQAKSSMLTAKAALVGKEADLSAAGRQIRTADAAIDQAKAELAAAKEQVAAAHAGIRQAQAQRNVAVQSVIQAQGRRKQAQGQLSQAHTASGHVAESKSAEAQAIAKVEQARATLRSAQLQLSYTRIYAPVNGRISNKNVEVGSQVQPAWPLMVLTPDESVWVAANFKETQLTGIRRGQRAEITVDAVPGHVFKGHVDSISPATGATFALLPPDNATGNFTKVVQRIPVKIVFDPGQPLMDRLRAGMSSIATVVMR